MENTSLGRTRNKLWLLLCLTLAMGAGTVSCKTTGRAAAKYWSEKQIEKFVADCEYQAGILVGQENVAHFCDCAVDKVSGKYHRFEDAENISILEIVKTTKGCEE
ncbi:MAG: hypothetical protein JKY54_11125 [Flavobacteriales bacterium]|nr:hypothetical protein [Flavobacteriales bacterium]